MSLLIVENISQYIFIVLSQFLYRFKLLKVPSKYLLLVVALVFSGESHFWFSPNINLFLKRGRWYLLILANKTNRNLIILAYENGLFIYYSAALVQFCHTKNVYPAIMNLWYLLHHFISYSFYSALSNYAQCFGIILTLPEKKNGHFCCIIYIVWYCLNFLLSNETCMLKTFCLIYVIIIICMLLISAVSYWRWCYHNQQWSEAVFRELHACHHIWWHWTDSWWCHIWW